jgi:hypothetical protein
MTPAILSFTKATPKHSDSTAFRGLPRFVQLA